MTLYRIVLRRRISLFACTVVWLSGQCPLRQPSNPARPLGKGHEGAAAPFWIWLGDWMGLSTMSKTLVDSPRYGLAIRPSDVASRRWFESKERNRLAPMFSAVATCRISMNRCPPAIVCFDEILSAMARTSAHSAGITDNAPASRFDCSLPKASNQTLRG